MAGRDWSVYTTAAAVPSIRVSSLPVLDFSLGRNDEGKSAGGGNASLLVKMASRKELVFLLVCLAQDSLPPSLFCCGTLSRSCCQFHACIKLHGFLLPLCSAGMNMANLAKVLRCAGSEDTLTIVADDNENNITLKFESPGEHFLRPQNRNTDLEIQSKSSCAYGQHKSQTVKHMQLQT